MPNRPAEDMPEAGAGLIGVTGATGRLGGRVARRLAAGGVAQRLVVRDPGRAPSLPGASAVRASFGVPVDARAALAGVTTLLMVSAAESADRVDQHRAFIDAAAAAGVTHLVYVSFYGASPTCTFTLGRDHAATERHIRDVHAATGLRFTFLRDNLYSDFLPALVGPDDLIRGPAGDGRVAAVTQDDIADAATAVLLAPSPHAGRIYSLTGPQALTLDQVAAALTEATGRRIAYRPETLDEAYASRAEFGAPAWQVDAWVSTYTAIAAGELTTVTTDIPELTGHPATSLADLLRRGTSARVDGV